MVAKIASSTLTGIDAEPVDVEVRTHENGEHYRFTVVGMADTAVRESRERVDAALRFSGFHVPKNILVNLAPAEVKKEGASFDLPMALGILIASGQLRNAEVEGFSIHGELSLDGQVKAIRGVVALAIQAREQGASTIFVPAENGAEAALIKGIDVIGVGSLVELVAIVTGSAAATPYAPAVQRTRKESPHLAEVWGQTLAKRALMIAAAGGHNIL